MQLRLREFLRRFEVTDAMGSLGGWHEAMLLVAGDLRPSVRLASRFRQRAVVILCRGRNTRLRLLAAAYETQSGKPDAQQQQRSRFRRCQRRDRARIDKQIDAIAARTSNVVIGAEIGERCDVNVVIVQPEGDGI
jgi:hypothetical protein